MSQPHPVIIDPKDLLHICPACNGQPIKEEIDELAGEVNTVECSVCDGLGLMTQRAIEQYEQLMDQWADAQHDATQYKAY